MFSVTSFVADVGQSVISLNWNYTNDDGKLANTLVLATPAGTVRLQDLTQETLVGWLEDQLENTPEELDNVIANAKQQYEFQVSCKQYSLDEATSTYAIVEDETPVSETEVVSN